MPFGISSRTSPTFGSFWNKLWVILGAIFKMNIFFFLFGLLSHLIFDIFLPFFWQIIKNFLTSIIALAKNAIRNIESGVFEDKPNLHRVELVDNEINHLKLSALSVGRVSPKGTVFCGFVLTSVSLLHIVSFLEFAKNSLKLYTVGPETPRRVSGSYFVQLQSPIHTLIASKLCNQVPSLSLSRWRTLTLLKI